MISTLFSSLEKEKSLPYNKFFNVVPFTIHNPIGSLFFLQLLQFDKTGILL